MQKFLPDHGRSQKIYMSKPRFILTEKGFTLVELMVVVVVVGILIAIAIPTYINVSENTKLHAHLANIKTIEEAVQMYKAANNTEDFIGIDVNESGSGVLAPKYIKEWPTKPGKYSVTDGVISANPNQNDTLEAIKPGGTAVTWP